MVPISDPTSTLKGHLCTREQMNIFRDAGPLYAEESRVRD